MAKQITTGKVTVDFLNLRSSPDGEVIKVLPQFTRLLITSRINDWFEVDVENKHGYVNRKFISIDDGTQIPEKILIKGKVTANKLNMRISPNGDVIEQLIRDAEVTILNEENDWFKIFVGDKTGFVSSQYIEFSEPAKPRTGQVATSKLNFRKSPNGEILNVLPRNTSVIILNDEESWLKIEVNGVRGFVSKQYITEENVESPPITSEFHYDDKSAIAPDGEKFGTKFRKGIYHYGDTSIKDFVEANRSLFPTHLNSYLNVMMAASENEGKYEAINTWDNCFLSFGIFQWTCGTTTAAGELPALLNRLHNTYPDTYENFFGQYGLAVTQVSQRRGTASRGFFRLNGTLLNDKESKGRLRTLPWAYRFWSAGYDEKVREIETLHAIDRVNIFYRQNNRKINNFYVADYINSEFGVALLLDQHVNRPGHVPKILAQAVEALEDRLPIDNPNSWGDNEEAILIEKYLQLREKTSMTHSTKRAESIRKKVSNGTISDKRRSFVESRQEEEQLP